MLLETRHLAKNFGGVHAVEDLALRLEPGQAFGLIGPNGAGKTTLINLISGHLRADGGSVLLDGAAVTRLAPHELTARGITRTFQGVQLFKGLTVLDNVLVGRHARMSSDLVRRLVPRRSRADPDRERAMGLLERVGLRRRAG